MPRGSDYRRRRAQRRLCQNCGLVALARNSSGLIVIERTPSISDGVADGAPRLPSQDAVNFTVFATSKAYGNARIRRLSFPGLKALPFYPVANPQCRSRGRRYAPPVSNTSLGSVLFFR